MDILQPNSIFIFLVGDAEDEHSEYIHTATQCMIIFILLGA